MADYFVYWLPATVRAQEQSEVNYVASKQLRRARVTEGDVLWPVTCPGSGSLTVVGRLLVRTLTDSRVEAERILGREGLWDAEAYPLAIATAPLDVSSLATDLRFEGAPDRLPENFTGQHLQSMRRLAFVAARRLRLGWAHKLVRGLRPGPSRTPQK